jgi:hypothetical protein
MELPEPFAHVEVVYEAIPPERVEALGLVDLGRRIRANDTAVLYRLGPLAILIEGTQRVTVDTNQQLADDEEDQTEWEREVAGDISSDDLIESLRIGFVPRTLFLHAGYFCLHGSLVQIGDRTVVICGHSTAGKSTTVSYLWHHHNATVLIDDVVPVEMVDGVAIATPYQRPVSLLDDAMDRIGLERTDVNVLDLGTRIKFVLEMARASGPVLIDAMVIIERAEDLGVDGPLRVREITGAERLRRVVRATNVTGLASLGQRSMRYFDWSTAYASAVPILEIQRSPEADTLAEIAQLIVDHVA